MFYHATDIFFFWRINAQPLEKLGTLGGGGGAVTSDPAFFGLLSFMNISHHLNLLLLD